MSNGQHRVPLVIPYPRIDPEIFRIGPFAVRWYGMMYVLGFASSYFLVLYQLKKKAIAITKAQIDDIYFYLVLGLLVGARLGYVLFYNLPFYLVIPWKSSSCGTAACRFTAAPSVRSCWATGPCTGETSPF